MMFRFRRGSFKNFVILIIIFTITYYILQSVDNENLKKGKEKGIDERAGDNDYVNWKLKDGKIDGQHVDVMEEVIDQETIDKLRLYFREKETFPDSGVRSEVGKKERVNYHNATQEAMDLARTGVGENSEPAKLTPEEEASEGFKELWATNGFNGLLSDKIALDRSIKDLRHSQCKKMTYRKHLPTVSVVIPFFEEHWTALLRTATSVINRSPPDVLREIILVDDGSTMKPELKKPLEDWLKEHLPKVWVHRIPDRMGLITARQEGAKRAKGDIIIVLDSHCEVSVNWLPPLIDPIADDYRTAVCPLIDCIDHNTFAYYPQDDGGRGAFDWRFYYKRLPLFPKDKANLPQPFENPVMNGGLFAISRKFFWELGGYDPELLVWGGEQYDLSFKIWQCGGRMLDAPCSRVGHIFRGPAGKRPASRIKGDTAGRNYKRVALVWMDEYKEALFQRLPHLRKLDAGDISEELRIRERLKCKSFKWFLENVASDLTKVWPPVEPPDFANGTVKSLAYPELCVDYGMTHYKPFILYPCHGLDSQFFYHKWRKSIRNKDDQFCWTSGGVQLGKAPMTTNCANEHEDKHQIWRLDPETHMLTEKANGWCLEAHKQGWKLSLEICDPSKETQKWTFSFMNMDRIKQDFPPF